MSTNCTPLVFISHKHCDREIADAVCGFIRDYSGGRIDVYQSSSPYADGPKPGNVLYQELVDKLWRSNLLLLLYTDADKDWSYCMWEAGVATKPESPDTHIIVLQCGKDRPQVFRDRISVNMRKLDEVQRFVNDFLTGKESIPRLGGPVTSFSSNGNEVARIAAVFFQKMAEVLPPEEGITEEWPASPYLQLSMDLSECDQSRLRKLSDEERMQCIQKHCIVVDADTYCAQLFGYSRFPRSMSLSELISGWAEQHEDVAWATALSAQITAAAMWQFPKPSWKCLHPDDRYFYAPVLSRVRRKPMQKCMEFDIYFQKFDVSPETSAIFGLGEETGAVVPMRH